MPKTIKKIPNFECYPDSDDPSLRVCSWRGNQPHTGPLCAIVPQLIKTHNLLPSRNYIFGYHPHGIFCFGAFCNFGTEATGFSKKFPGIKPSLATLAGNFRFPILRDYLMSGGEMIWEQARSLVTSDKYICRRTDLCPAATVCICWFCRFLEPFCSERLFAVQAP